LVYGTGFSTWRNSLEKKVWERVERFEIGEESESETTLVTYSASGNSCPTPLWRSKNHEKENNSINAASYPKCLWMEIERGYDEK